MSLLSLPIAAHGSCVIVKRFDAPEVSPGGIVIPDVSRERPSRGIVLDVGPGEVMTDGTVERPGVRKGDLVLFGLMKGTEIVCEGEEVTILRGDDVLAVAYVE